MNVLQFMARTANWMNRFLDDRQSSDGAVQGGNMSSTQVIAVFNDDTYESKVVYDVVGIETQPGGDSMVLILGTPEATYDNPLDAQEAQDEEEAVQEA